MARPPRLHFRGAVYHVTTRAVEGIPVFADAKMKRMFLDILSKVQAELPFTLHGYCIMSNHVHLIISVQDVPLARILHRVLTTFSTRYNLSHGRMGHVFQSRCTVRLCHDDAYLMTLLRYVHLNPVKAGLVENPADWPWSSHLDYLGLREGSIVDTSLGLSAFHPDPRTARKMYQAFVERPGAPIEPPSEQEGPAPAQPRLVAAPATPSPPSLETLVSQVCRDEGLTPELLKGDSRARPLSAARKRLIRTALLNGHRGVDIAALLDRTPAWVAKVRDEALDQKLN